MTYKNLNKQDESVQNMSLTVGTGKMHVKNPSEK